MTEHNHDHKKKKPALFFVVTIAKDNFAKEA